MNLGNWFALPAGSRLWSQPIFVQSPAVLQRSPPENNVMLLATGKISECEGKFIVRYNAEIRLNARFQKYAGFGIALCQNAIYRGVPEKVFNNAGRGFCCDE